MLALPASAQTHRRTVLDYFKMLPSKRFFATEQFPPIESRMKWLREGFDPTIPADNRSVVDLKNDFLRSPGDGEQSGFDVAVFRFHGRDTVAVRQRYGADEDLSFWREQKGRLVEITKSVFPSQFRSGNGNFAITVPQHGTTIRVLKMSAQYQPTKTVLARFLWRGGHFVRA